MISNSTDPFDFLGDGMYWPSRTEGIVRPVTSAGALIGYSSTCVISQNSEVQLPYLS